MTRLDKTLFLKNLFNIIAGSTTPKTVSSKLQQYHKPAQSHHKFSTRGSKHTSPVIRKQTTLKSSPSSDLMWTAQDRHENEDTLLLGKIVFNLELDRQQEHCNQGDLTTITKKIGFF